MNIEDFQARFQLTETPQKVQTPLGGVRNSFSNSCLTKREIVPSNFRGVQTPPREE